MDPQTQQVDYDALAQQHGGQIAAPAVDYDALAAQHGGQAVAAKSPDTGVMASLKRTGSGLIHLPGSVLDAFTKPPANPQEQAASIMPVGAAGGAVALPPSIALGLHRLIVAPMMAEADKAKQMRADAQTQTPEQANNPYNGTEHLANMHQLASIFPVLGPVAADITQRYLTGDKSGAVTDLATNVAGPKIAEQVGGGLIKAGNKMIQPALQDTAHGIYQSALKPSIAKSAPDPAALVKTGLDAGIPISEKGAQQLGNLIDNLNDTISGKIKAGARSGQTVDPQAVAARTDGLKSQFATQVNPEADLKAIDASKSEFLRNNPNPIPVDQAQAMKVGTYRQLRGKFGELGAAAEEAQKALARGIKEELQTQFPELQNLNAQEAKFLNLDGPLNKAIQRMNNKNTMPLSGPIAGAATAAATGSTGVGAVAGVMKYVLSDPAMASRLAIALNKAGRGGISIGLANARVSQFVNALAQSTSAGQRNESPAQ